jgi:iron-sulfur cluster assembly protein
MALDEPRDDDHIVETDGIKLFIDPVSGRYLQGAEIGYENSPLGGGFTINNPNHDQLAGDCSSCGQRGCGDADDDGCCSDCGDDDDHNG